MPGITFTAGEGGVQGDQINIRGYSARNDIYRDGIRDPGWYARDAFSFDRVEVYKGPSSFLFGRGSTGGVINIVSKLPQNRDFYVVEGTGYSSPGGRVTTDFNKTFGDVTARLAMVGYDTDVADRDFAHIKRFGFAPSVSWQIDDQTRNTLAYVYQNDDNIADRGIPMLPGSYFGTAYRQPAPVPRNTYYGVATPGQNDVEQTQAHNLINKFEHEFAPGLKLTNLTGYSAVDRYNRTRPVQLSAASIPRLRILGFVAVRRHDPGWPRRETRLRRRPPSTISGSPTPTTSRTKLITDCSATSPTSTPSSIPAGCSTIFWLAWNGAVRIASNSGPYSTTRIVSMLPTQIPMS